jgi:ABC-2 type transport system permease protein
MNHHLRASVSRAGTWLRPVQALIGKELLQLTRDRTLLFFIIYIFTANIIIAAGEVSTELHDARVVVHDADKSAASRELIYRFRPPYFRLAGEVERPADGTRLLERGRAMMLIDIPDQFERTLRRGERPAAVQVLIDTSQANSGFLAASYSARIAAAFSQEMARQNLGASGRGSESLPTVENQRRIWFNPTLNESWFGAISELMTMITVACLLLPAAAMVREKERGTIEQLLVSPLTPFQIMLPKVMAMVLVTLIGVTVSLFGIMVPFFSLPIQGNVGLFLFLTALYAVTLAGLGLVGATFARSSGQVGMLLLLLVMPMVMLSGIQTPPESMPEWLQTLIHLNPLEHYIEITYGILLRGAGLDTLWDSVLSMVLLGSGLFALGARRFRLQFK